MTKYKIITLLCFIYENFKELSKGGWETVIIFILNRIKTLVLNLSRTEVLDHRTERNLLLW